MKNILIAISFVIAIPFLALGFAWKFITYCFEKGEELCKMYFDYLE